MAPLTMYATLNPADS